MVRRTRKIIWTVKSISDKQEIFSYWNQRNKSVLFSRKLDKMFDEKMRLVSELPFIGRKTLIDNVRSVLVRDCLIVYEILPEEIIVIGVWEGHQYPEKLDI